MVKKWIALFCLILLFAACAPETTPEPVSITPLPTYTLQPGTALYDGCAYSFAYPSHLTIEGAGWYATLSQEKQARGMIVISADKITEGDLEYALENAIIHAKEEAARTVTEETTSPVVLVDFHDQEIPALQADLVSEEEHTRILVALRQDTLLGDLLPSEVIYKIHMTVPNDSWESWEAVFDIIRETFMPFDCGGV